MSLLNKAKAITKKLETIITKRNALDGLIQGVYHYNNPDPIIENLKNERAEICNGCDKIETDDFQKIKDTDKRISDRMCGECFCSLPYLLRQTKKGCELNKWD